jgi:hypothetical protein
MGGVDDSRFTVRVGICAIDQRPGADTNEQYTATRPEVRIWKKIRASRTLTWMERNKGGARWNSDPARSDGDFSIQIEYAVLLSIQSTHACMGSCRIVTVS